MQARRTMTGTFLSIGLLVTVMALIAGVLGMHVMTGLHTQHPMTTAATTTVISVETVDHGTAAHDHHRGEAGTTDAEADAGPAVGPAAGGPAQCACSGNCSTEHAMGVFCVPSTATGVLAAPLPDTSTTVPSSFRPVATGSSTLWSYLPGSPSPGELSISRT
ncbi:hypothetical protein IG195_18775 [Arthrobacter sp. TES]|uniref:Uncharacterized protein n=1 Tax=Paenarthrobacter ureafaciens TaxID=37931 RepID=A0AAX3EN95_PAEUR|nr:MULTISPECIES: hypothetical protein [Paenarthrobacter]AOY71661.1 hypothetical protein ARZXY2_2117 [Arthrobacter sp. ZXY-2]NKR14039.1 hypothetical protein [Arthrobacter sp. M5]NKR17837.1 hypothetical protein [Arthrobacter sp. M6]OEH56655.1 hypothetical protein A5N17_04365 [Arthrobacter sp. D2]OEH57879.1 hypothetical protein A5N13_06885 [Arthrobacter sp. D4]QOI63475.1 hypothetical protein IG195_18775 [Arthrobacter sp. TES]